MDPYAHTIIALVLLYLANWFGKRSGRQEGINAAVSYLVEMGACSEKDIQKANERFMDGDDI